MRKSTVYLGVEASLSEPTMRRVLYRFNNFVLDCNTRQLLHDDADVHLSPKAFELLRVLITNRARALSKAELLECLWPSTFVEETNLAGLAAELRRALKDSAERPRFLRTVYGFGYRFTGDVVESDIAATPKPSGPRPRLVFENRQAFLMDGANIIGRAPDAGIQCEAAGVSRHHARIIVASGEATLEDLGSKNGTYVQNRRITSARLSDGDAIQLGKATLIFRAAAVDGTTETVAADPTERSR